MHGVILTGPNSEDSLKVTAYCHLLVELGRLCKIRLTCGEVILKKKIEHAERIEF